MNVKHHTTYIHVGTLTCTRL